MDFIHQNPLLSAHPRERNYLREYLRTVHREELELDPWGRPNYRLCQDVTQTQCDARPARYLVQDPSPRSL